MIILFSLFLFLFFNPLYANYTSLLSSQYAWLFYIWVLCLACIFVYKLYRISSIQEKKWISLLAILFVVGCYIPYKSIYIFSILHVFIPLSIVCLVWIYIFLKIKEKEPLQAQILYQWYFWGLSIISLLVIFFGSINGIIEISALSLTIFLLNKLRSI